MSPPDRRAELDAAERALQARLGAEGTAPFLGHHELAAPIAQMLAAESGRGEWRIEDRLRHLFHRWPALTVAWIAHTVAERYGSETGKEIYPHLSGLFGVSDLDPNSRARIASQFRSACRKLDLPLPEGADPVDAYVVQAGVPHVQVDRLRDALDRTERREGLPERS